MFNTKNSLLRKQTRKFSSKRGNSLRRTLTPITKNQYKRDLAQTVTLEEVHLIVKRCADKIRERGLHVVDIFKPMRIGDNVDDVRKLISCLLRETRAQCDKELEKLDIHIIVSAMKWALRHCVTTIVPYQFYEEFVIFEQESDFDPDKGSFKQFLCYLPKQNRDILVELFDICAQVTAESHINNMPVERLVKTLALCILGDKDKPLEGFEGAYNEWTKCSQACLHLFLAYLREKAVSTELNPRLTVLIDNYVEYRKKSVTSVYFKASNSNDRDDGNDDNNIQQPETSNNKPKIFNRPRNRSIVTFAEKTTEFKTPVSILKVIREVPARKSEVNQQTRSFTTLLPNIMGNIKRKTIIKSSTIMTTAEKKSAEEMWEEFQDKGIGALSDDFIKLFFSLESRAAEVKQFPSRTEKQWGSFSKKGFQSIYMEPLSETKNNEKKSLLVKTSSSMKNTNNDNEDGSSNDLVRNDSLRQTVAWDSFSEKGFEESDVLSLVSSLGKKKFVKFRSLRRTRSLSPIKKLIALDLEEDWEDWGIIDRREDLPITTHLAIETIDEIFPYVWMETTVEDEGDKWGDWIFIEPRNGLIHECEWVMIEEKAQVSLEWEKSFSYSKRRKLSALSTFSIPWVRPGAVGKKSRPASKASTRFSMASTIKRPVPAIMAMFDRSRPDDQVFATNYKFPPNAIKKYKKEENESEEIKQMGYEEGYEEQMGYEEGYEEQMGYEEGYEGGYEEGYEKENYSEGDWEGDEYAYSSAKNSQYSENDYINQYSQNDIPQLPSTTKGYNNFAQRQMMKQGKLVPSQYQQQYQQPLSTRDSNYNDDGEGEGEDEIIVEENADDMEPQIIVSDRRGSEEYNRSLYWAWSQKNIMWKCSEAGKSFDGDKGTKLLYERGIKALKMMKDMFQSLCLAVGMEEEKKK
ncbi:8267_t:CDS:2 [Entrophospora sp. SA101]|nr:8267_t:CDS:2 [Entrophospora sp. SA101]